MTATISGVGTGEYRAMAGSGGRLAAIPGTNGTGTGPQPAFLSPSASDAGVIPSPLVATSSDSASVPIVSQPQKSGSKGLLMVAVLGILVAAAGGLVFMMKGSNANTASNAAPGAATVTAPPTTSAVAPPPVATQAAADPTQAPAPVVAGLVKVRLNSDPSGARVEEDGIEICSSTPCDIPYKGPEADATKEHKLTFSKAGFKNESKTIKVGDSPVTVKLTKAPTYAAPATEKKEPPAQMPGYKGDIPY
jgi:serine/threonine-protein kinase